MKQLLETIAVFTVGFALGILARPTPKISIAISRCVIFGELKLPDNVTVAFVNDCQFVADWDLVTAPTNYPWVSGARWTKTETYTNFNSHWFPAR